MGYAFISYSTQNQDWANQLNDHLKSSGTETWMAPNNIPIGSNYAETINRAIKNCSCFILLLTKEAQESVWVTSEVERARNYRRMVFPMMIGSFELNDAFEFYLGMSQIFSFPTFDLSNPQFQNVLAGIQNHIEKQKQPQENAPKKAVPAPKPEPKAEPKPKPEPKPESKPEPVCQTGPEPDSSAGLIRTANAFLREQQPAQARAAFVTVLEHNRKDYRAWWGLALADFLDFPHPLYQVHDGRYSTHDYCREAVENAPDGKKALLTGHVETYNKAILNYQQLRSEKTEKAKKPFLWDLCVTILLFVLAAVLFFCIASSFTTYYRSIYSFEDLNKGAFWILLLLFHVLFGLSIASLIQVFPTEKRRKHREAWEQAMQKPFRRDRILTILLGVSVLFSVITCLLATFFLLNLMPPAIFAFGLSLAAFIIAFPTRKKVQKRLEQARPATPAPDRAAACAQAFRASVPGMIIDK